MSGTDNQEKESLDAFDLAGFIEERSELFVVMGVFGALAIYIAQSTGELGTTTDSELMTTVGFVSAFALSILMLVLVYKKLIEEFGDWHTTFRAHLRVRNAPLALFSLLAFVLIISISHILTRHEPVVFILLLTATYAAGVGVVMRLVYSVTSRVPRTLTWLMSAILLACSSAFVGARYLHENFLNQIEMTTIYGLSLSDPVTIGITVAYLFVSTIRGVAMLGVFVTGVGIPIVLMIKLARI